MQIKKASLYKAKLHLKKSFKHGSFERHHNDTIFLELKGEKHTGFGECLPREYVTGETPEQVAENLKTYVLNLPKEFRNLEEIANFLKECETEDSKDMASLCGLDMALLDLYGKSKGKSLSGVLCYELKYRRTKRPKVTSGPMGLNTAGWKKNFYCSAGILDIKLKITANTDPKKIHKFRNRFIKPRTFRLDGNCSLTHDELASLLIRAKSDINYIEQPFPTNVKNPQWEGVKFLADESLVSLENAKTIDFDAASIRVGKNGGILRTLDIIDIWEKRDKEYMIGSLVGETSLLSSALLHIASITHPFLNEGCYSTRLLKQDPTDIHPSTGYMGRVKFDYTTPGLGINLYLFDRDIEKVELI